MNGPGSNRGTDRWLVVGASGLVGGELVRRLSAYGERVVGAARTAQGEATRVVDLTARKSIDRILAETSPTVVVIASAWPHVDGCEQDPARSKRENVQTAENLIASLKGSDARIVFYSTDHVFDGAKDGAYVESDRVRPLSVYAQHKREVEELLLVRGRSLTIRTAWVFGQETRKKNFVYRVINVARSGETLLVPAKQAGCPTWSAWLAETTRSLVGSGMEGIVHATGHELFDKAQWARAIAAELQLPELHVEEVDWKSAGQVAPRPVRVALRSERHSFIHPDVRNILQTEREALLR